MPIVYLNFFKKDFINGIKNIVNFYKEVKQVKKKLILSEISDIYIFGTAVSFVNMVAVTHLKFNKIINIDYMQMNKTLAQSKHAKEGYLFTNFSFHKLRFYIFFSIFNSLVFFKYTYWSNEKYLLYFQKKKVKNMIYLNTKIFYNDIKFIKFIDDLIVKKYIKKSIILPFSLLFFTDENLKILKKILIKYNIYKDHNIYVKFKRNVSKDDQKKSLFHLQKIMNEKKN